MLVYETLCPVCGGDLSFEEVEKGFCFSRNEKLCSENGLTPFLNLFSNCIGKPREIQKLWAKRVLRGESFALTAPTGIGKTSFGLLVSLFFAMHGKRCYVIFPTSLLVKQAVQTLEAFAQKAGINLVFNESGEVPVGFYHAEIDEKERFFEKLGDYKILVTTAQFLAKNFEKMKDLRFDFIFVDDVDALLKASKNVERILELLGVKNGKKGVLVVSTATAKVGKKAALFRKFLNFSVGSSQFYLRNIEDIIANEVEVKEILQKMGSGGIIYARSVEECEEIYENLYAENLRIGIVTSKKSKDFDLFIKGDLDYLIGTAHHYGSLVRGIDLPERIKFAIFINCPIYRLRVEDLDTASPAMLRMLAHLYRDDERVAKFIAKLKMVEKISEELKEALKAAMSEKNIFVRDAVVKRSEIVFPDIRTYLQASGRTSRLTAQGITKGASFLFEKDSEILRAFVERAKLFDISFKDISEINLENLRKELEESRRFKKEVDLIKPILFVVESPTKAKQIAKFFGKPSIRFINSIPVYEVPTDKYLLLITATLGHLTDLVTDRGFYGVENFRPIYTTIKRCKKCGNQFTEKICPRCGSNEFEDSRTRISVLRKIADEVESVIVGTDPDAEGEKIAYDIRNLLCREIRRAEFHEVTRRAIINALENLRNINENLIKAQIVRRVEDRWIGFALSQKLQNVFNRRNLSAGRAQTPVLGWIIDRYSASRKKKVIAFIPEFELYIETDKSELELKVELIEERVEKKTPLPPYTTDSLLFDANIILKLSANQAMKLAQDLFENGLITYHRTDSTRVSEVGMNIARDYLGDDFQGREWFAEGAHECIRPTRALDRSMLERLIYEGIIDVEGFEWTHFALYDLIFRRFMSSQCRDYSVRIKRFRIVADGKTIEEERIVEASGRAFELYKSVWIKKDLECGNFRVQAEIRKIPSASLLTQAEVLKIMKERGIGRPSTYAVIIDKLFSRGYVFEKNGKLIPTRDGINIYDYLVKNYESFISESRTKVLEEKMDAIENGEVDYLSTLRELYEEIMRVVN